jgi:hypothetical protein
MTALDRYTTEEMASILDVRVETLYDHRWRGQSKCPLFRNGKRLFAFRNEFDKWYEGRIQYV